MKSIIILITISALCQASSLILDDWKKFKLEHNKVYVNSVEERTRFSIFQDNLKEIEEHNRKYESGLVSWKQGITPFTDWTKEEFLSYLNFSGILKMPTEAKSFTSDPDFEVPDKFNWRDQGKVSPVKTVAQCGSYWAFDVAGAIESQLLIRNQRESLSEQQLVDCTTEVGNRGCHGGFVDKTFDYIKDKGIMSDYDYPYTAMDGTCKYMANKTVTKISGYVSGNNETMLKELVATKGPTVVYLDARYLQHYKSGIFDINTCSQVINYSMLTVGYDTSEEKKDYWILKGSWSAGWGESGFARIARGKKLCAIGNYDFVPYL